MPTDDRTRRRLERLLGKPRDPSRPDPEPDPGAPGPIPDGRQERIEALRLELRRITGKRIDQPRTPDTVHPKQVPESWTDPLVLLPGEEVAGAAGSFWMRERRYDPHQVHGTEPLAAALELTGEAASLLALDRGLAGFDMTRAVYLDIESTGLSMGTGTIAFLIGLGWFDKGAFVVRQLFVNRLENEPAVLEAMTERLGQDPTLVTYNGKSFDVPVLRARLALSRMGTAIDSGGHLDLLHATRRIYKRRIGDCSLGSVERSVLGFFREGDIPSELIPEIFVEYLRTGRTGQMSDVFHHNLLDVVSMAALAGHMARLATTLPSEVPAGDLDDIVSVARVRLRHGDLEHAKRLLGHAKGSGCAEHRIESRLQLARMARKKGEPALERELLEQLVEDDPDHAEAHLMLAKLLEHRLGLYDLALEHARRAEDAEGFEASGRRIDRLERKLAMASGRGPSRS